MNKLTLSQLASLLFRACDDLRGNMDASEYIVNNDPGITVAQHSFLSTLNGWWQEHLPEVEGLAPAEDGGDQSGNVYDLRRSLLESIEQIGEILRATDQETFDLHSDLKKVKKLKAGLMSDLLSGRTEVSL